jgi:hypothetical protein
LIKYYEKLLIKNSAKMKKRSFQINKNLCLTQNSNIENNRTFTNCYSWHFKKTSLTVHDTQQKNYIHTFFTFIIQQRIYKLKTDTKVHVFIIIVNATFYKI